MAEPSPKNPFEDIYNQPGDPPALKICRGCAEHGDGSLVHPCDGNGCECAMCSIAHTAQEMSDYLDQREREDGWPN